jgi:hypothetical protein
MPKDIENASGNAGSRQSLSFQALFWQRHFYHHKEVEGT